jgi:hypothetical protein
MNDDLQTTRKLLADLRDEYRTLPRHFQAEVRSVLGALAQEQAAQMIGQRRGECDHKNPTQVP